MKVNGGLSKQHDALSDPSPTDSTTTKQSGLPHPGKYLRLHHLQHNKYAETKKYGPNGRTDQSSKNRTKQQRDSQLIRCTVQNTGNQDAHRIGEYGCKIEEKLKAMKSEIKENIQGTNSKGKEIGTQINDLE